MSDESAMPGEMVEKSLGPNDEVVECRRLAERYRLDYVDMKTFVVDQSLFRAIPADLMLRYRFVPLRRDETALVIVAGRGRESASFSLLIHL